MKTREILTILFIVVLIFSGCREITVTTQVHRDGSFTRTVRITGDSSSVFEGDLPYPIDSTWEQVAIKDTTSNDSKNVQYILTYSKTFNTSEELNSQIDSDTSWRKQLNRQIKVTNRFGFFYSYLTFRETFPPSNPCTFLPYEDYLSPEDLQWLTGQKSIISKADSSYFDKVEEKALNFIFASITAEMEQILKEGITRLNNPSLQPDEVDRFHDSIFHYVSKWEFDKPVEFIDHFRDWTGNPVVNQLHNLTPGLFDSFMKKVSFLDLMINMESYSETIEMPGLIIETNSLMLKGNQVSWEVQPMNFLFTEYEMVVESRVVNNWAFVVTGLILLLLIIILIVKAVKK